MNEQTFIKGKDSTLEDSIAGIYAKLDRIGLSIA
jgi:hypothetical protein